MICRRSSHHGTANRGSTLVAALALVFLIFAVTTISLARVAMSFSRISMRHNASSALFLADAGIQKAAHRLALDSFYRGERNTRLATGSFDVTVTPGARGYIVISTGHPSSAIKSRLRKTIMATVVINSRSFRVTDWRENP